MRIMIAIGSDTPTQDRYTDKCDGGRYVVRNDQSLNGLLKTLRQTKTIERVYFEGHGSPADSKKIFVEGSCEAKGGYVTSQVIGSFLGIGFASSVISDFITCTPLT